MESIYNKITEVLKNRQEAALCTIVSTIGSTPLKSGAKMIVWENGQIFGTIGGGRLEKAVTDDAVSVIKNRKPQLFSHELKDQHRMCCGGSLEIFIEPIMQSKKLFIFGGGHVGKAIVKHALDLDFDISVIDSRKEIFNDWTFTGFSKVTGEFADVLPTLGFDESSFIVIATYDHQTDREVLSFCINKPHYYLGMIGSKNKIAITRQKFISAGIAAKEDLDNVDMPVGIDINAETADEIAVSIVAKLISEKNKPIKLK
jgi:xanthine dehydrogenase accessory factor